MDALCRQDRRRKTTELPVVAFQNKTMFKLIILIILFFMWNKIVLYISKENIISSLAYYLLSLYLAS